MFHHLHLGGYTRCPLNPTLASDFAHRCLPTKNRFRNGTTTPTLLFSLTLSQHTLSPSACTIAAFRNTRRIPLPQNHTAAGCRNFRHFLNSVAAATGEQTKIHAETNIPQ
jgi:hypothetical protein